MLDGKQVLDERIPGHSMKGAWGFGALSGSAGIWERFELE